MLPSISDSATQTTAIASACQPSPVHRVFCSSGKGCHRQLITHSAATAYRSSGQSLGTICIHTSHRLPHTAARRLQQPPTAQFAGSVPAGVSAMKEASQGTHSTAPCRAYVGETTPAAAEYHCNDFDWEELKQEAEAMLAKRHAQLQVIDLQAHCLLVYHLAADCPN